MGSAETRGAGASKNALNSPTRSANLEDCKRRCAIVGRVFRNSQDKYICFPGRPVKKRAPRKENPSKREQEARDHGERQ
jgi:hypothetical protein